MWPRHDTRLCDRGIRIKNVTDRLRLHVEFVCQRYADHRGEFDADDDDESDEERNVRLDKRQPRVGQKWGELHHCVDSKVNHKHVDELYVVIWFVFYRFILYYILVNIVLGCFMCFVPR